MQNVFDKYLTTGNKKEAATLPEVKVKAAPSRPTLREPVD